MDYKFFTDMMKNELNKTPSPKLTIVGKKVTEGGVKEPFNPKTNRHMDVGMIKKEMANLDRIINQEGTTNDRVVSYKKRYDELSDRLDSLMDPAGSPANPEVDEAKKEKKDDTESPLAAITSVDKDGKGPSIDNCQPEAPKQEGDAVADEADQIPDLKDNDKKDQVNVEVVEEPKKKKNEAVSEADFGVQTPGDVERAKAGVSDEPVDTEAPAEPEAPKSSGKPPAPKDDEEGVPEEPTTEEPKKKVTLGQSADQFFYYQPADQGGVVLDAEEKELKKIVAGPILPQILDLVRELKIDLIGAQFVTDYILPEIEAKHAKEEQVEAELKPAEELPTEQTEELPVPPANPNETIDIRDFLTALYEDML